MLSKLLTRREQWVIGLTAIAIVSGAAALLFAPTRAVNAPLKQPPPIEVPEAAPIPLASTQPAPAPPPAKITIAVRGAVRAPGVFQMPADSTVDDAISRSGGATEEANLDDINLAAPLVDNSTLTIPHAAIRKMEEGRLIARPGERAADLNPGYYTVSGFEAARQPYAATGSPSLTTSDGRVNLNSANSAALETLPGIGPVLAGEIIAYRQQHRFTRVEDLLEVKGIGPKKLEAIRSLVTVESPDSH